MNTLASPTRGLVIEGHEWRVFEQKNVGTRMAFCDRVIAFQYYPASWKPSPFLGWVPPLTIEHFLKHIAAMAYLDTPWVERTPNEVAAMYAGIRAAVRRYSV